MIQLCKAAKSSISGVWCCLLCWSWGSYRGWNSDKERPVRPHNSQVRASLTFFLHQSINHFHYTFHHVMSPGRRAYFVEEVFYCIVLLRSYNTPYVPPSSLPPAKRKTLAERQRATRGRPKIHQPANRCDPILFSSWWSDDLMLTIICPAAHYFDVQTVNFDS